jgi:hypothetical protein
MISITTIDLSEKDCLQECCAVTCSRENLRSHKQICLCYKWTLKLLTCAKQEYSVTHSGNVHSITTVSSCFIVVAGLPSENNHQQVGRKFDSSNIWRNASMDQSYQCNVHGSPNHHIASDRSLWIQGPVKLCTYVLLNNYWSHRFPGWTEKKVKYL